MTRPGVTSPLSHSIQDCKSLLGSGAGNSIGATLLAPQDLPQADGQSRRRSSRRRVRRRTGVGWPAEAGSAVGGRAQQDRGSQGSCCRWPHSESGRPASAPSCDDGLLRSRGGRGVDVLDGPAAESGGGRWRGGGRHVRDVRPELDLDGPGSEWRGPPRIMTAPERYFITSRARATCARVVQDQRLRGVGRYRSRWSRCTTFSPSVASECPASRAAW